jgi:hypothetical protein
MGLNSIEVCWLFATAHKLTNEINIAFNTTTIIIIIIIIVRQELGLDRPVSACLLVSSRVF